MADRSDGTRESSARAGELAKAFQLTGQLPLAVLPPEALARVQAGRELTPGEWDLVQSAVLRRGGMRGEMIEAVPSSGAFASRTSADAHVAPSSEATSEGGIPVSRRTRTFTWTSRAGHDRPTAAQGPATYYEALTGERDPRRDSFIAARRVLNLVVWAITLGVPLTLVAIAIATGEALDTIVLLGAFGLIVGAMIRQSISRLPFA